MKVLLMYGPPGSGKGTQSKLLPMVHVSSGELLRSHPLAQKFMDENPGKLVPDEVVDLIIESRICEIPADLNIILDGYPRTVQQAERLLMFLEFRNIEKIHLIFLQLEDEKEAVRRITEANRNRKDDDPKTIEKRFCVYREETKPVHNFLLRELDSVLTVDAALPVHAVSAAIKSFLKISAQEALLQETGL